MGDSTSAVDRYQFERVDDDHTWEGSDNTDLNCTAVEPWSVFRFREDNKDRVDFCPNCGRSLQVNFDQKGAPDE